MYKKLVSCLCDGNNQRHPIPTTRLCDPIRPEHCATEPGGQPRSPTSSDIQARIWRIHERHSKPSYQVHFNWELADFEIHELMEIFEDIQNYETDRMESRSIPIIYAPLDSINFAIQQKNQKLFQRDFNLLTNTCNACHREVNFGFNVVTIPQFNPFANQDFNPSH